MAPLRFPSSFLHWLFSDAAARAELELGAGADEVTVGRHWDPRTRLPYPSGFSDPSLFLAGPAWLSLPLPLVHPGSLVELAQVLDLTQAEVRAISRCDTCLLEGRPASPEELSELDHEEILQRSGAGALREALEARGESTLGIIDRVLVVPPEERPEELSDAGQLLPNEVGRAYEALFGVAARLKQYIELDAPSSMRMQALEAMQDAMYTLANAGRGLPILSVQPRDTAWARRVARVVATDLWSEDDCASAIERWHYSRLPTADHCADERPLDPLCPLRCGFVQPNALLLVLPYSVVLLDLDSGARRFVAPAPWINGLSVLRISPAGDTALFVARGALHPELYLLDLRTGHWLERTVTAAACSFPFAVRKSYEWGIWDTVDRSVLGPRHVSNWTGGATLSACGEYAWIHDDTAIIRVADMRPQLAREALGRRCPPLVSRARPEWAAIGGASDDADQQGGRGLYFAQDQDNEEQDDEEQDDEEQDDEGDARRAVAKTDRGLLTFWRGSLSLGTETLHSVRTPHSAVALDAAGRRLVVCRAGQVTLHEIDPAGVVGSPRTLSLQPLDHELSLVSVRDQVSGLTPAGEAQILGRFTTRAGATAATVAALCAAPTWGPSAVNADVASRLAEALRIRGAS